MIMEVTLVSTLRVDTATRLVNQGFGSVLDLRTSIGSTAGRPIEEPVLKTLRQGFVDYDQMPVDLHDCDGPGLGDAIATIFAFFSDVQVSRYLRVLPVSINPGFADYVSVYRSA